MEVKCPRCGQPTLFKPENPYRPFCSERCKLIDLGAWAEGKYTVPVVSDEEPQELSEEADDSEDPRH